LSKELSIQKGNNIDSGKGNSLSVRWNRRLSNRLLFLIPKSMGFGQTFSGLRQKL